MRAAEHHAGDAGETVPRLRLPTRRPCAGHFPGQDLSLQGPSSRRIPSIHRFRRSAHHLFFRGRTPCPCRPALRYSRPSHEIFHFYPPFSSHRRRKRHWPMQNGQCFRLVLRRWKNRLFSRAPSLAVFPFSRPFSFPRAIPWPPAMPSRIPSEPAFSPANPSPTAAVPSHGPPRAPSGPSAPATPSSPAPRTA